MKLLNCIPTYIRSGRSNRGAALAISLAWLGMLTMMGTGVVSYTSTSTVRVVSEEYGSLALNAAEAGLHFQYNNLWREFRIHKTFDELDVKCGPAKHGFDAQSFTQPVGTGEAAMLMFWTRVTKYEEINRYARRITIQSIGWVDSNGNGQLDAGETVRGIESKIMLELERSKVFDYAYFVNNYGWMYGFNQNQLIVNGDMRANGDFDFTGGFPTINGSVYAARNNKLIPPASGIVNITPTQWTNSFYNSNAPQTARQSYQLSRMGAKGSDQYEKWRDLIYDMDAGMVRGKPSGAVVADANGTRSYNGTVLDPQPTEELPMPDLSDIEYYKDLSRNYLNTKRKFSDNSNNPYYNQPAYIEVYSDVTKKYERITTNGIYNGSLALIGTTAKPIIIHGPVTVTEDVVIKGVVQGQGTIYAGRNVHIVGSITYAQGPNFSGNDIELVDKANEKKDLLGLCARGSIMMGNTKNFNNTVLQYMTPPFTKARYDDDGNLIPAFNAKEVDYTGRMRYQSTFGDNYINSISENVQQINAVLYTNFLGGGLIGGGGNGVTFNGSIISRDEAMILQSLPMRMNYDNRLRWRVDMGEPLIDINLPRSPAFNSLAWGEIDLGQYY